MGGCGRRSQVRLVRVIKVYECPQVLIEIRVFIYQAAPEADNSFPQAKIRNSRRFQKKLLALQSLITYIKIFLVDGQYRQLFLWPVGYTREPCYFKNCNWCQSGKIVKMNRSDFYAGFLKTRNIGFNSEKCRPFPGRLQIFSFHPHSPCTNISVFVKFPGISESYRNLTGAEGFLLIFLLIP